ncbi:alanine racemase [Oceanithermus sp.]
MRPTWLEISLPALAHNYTLLSERAPRSQLIAVIKANAYGHGAVTLARFLLGLGASFFAVATSGEARELRNAGIDVPILVLGALHPDNAADVAAAAAIPSITNPEAARAFAAALPGGTVHLKVDSGMGRVGVAPRELAALVNEVEGLGLQIGGIYTHFAVADEDPAETRSQLQTFLAAAASLPRSYPLHAANSAAVLKNIATDLDFIRPGLALYGLSPDMKNGYGLQPALSWKARPTQVKRPPRGHGIGYGLTYRASGDEWIATLPFGYADGFSRALSNRGWVRWRGGYAPVVGRVSMDQTTISLPEEVGPEEVFEVVTPDLDERTSLTGRARQLGTINYELATALSGRLPRIYQKER